MLLSLAMVLAIKRRSARLRRSISYAYHALSRYNIRSININEMTFHSDRQCVDNCRMDRRSLSKLCYLLTTRGKLKGNRNMSINELVISFLHIIAHNVKNRVRKRQIARSGETISRQFHLVLNSIMRLHNILLKKPEPIPENCTDVRWKWFKGFLGALDGTYINVNVPANDKPRYRTRKGEIATNVLGVCTPNMQFSYVLSGWEGSAADGRVLRDAISRRNGLKIPQGQRYHLTEWRQGYQPATAKEYFNMKHSQARNCIERYEMTIDPIETELDFSMEGKSQKMPNVVENVESSMPPKIKRKTQSTKRLWTKQEDAALVDCLVELSKDSAWEREWFSNWVLDHATGANAETPADAVEEINLCDEEIDTSNAEIFAECYKGEESNDVNQAVRKSETLDSSICPSNKKSTTRKRKGKADDALDDLVGEIHKYVIAVTEANEEMKGISTYFKKQTESGDRKMKIYDELIELSEFSEQEIMDVGEHILKDEHKINNFFAMPKAFRRNYHLFRNMSTAAVCFPRTAFPAQQLPLAKLFNEDLFVPSAISLAVPLPLMSLTSEVSGTSEKGLPPYIGILLGLGVLWILTDAIRIADTPEHLAILATSFARNNNHGAWICSTTYRTGKPHCPHILDPPFSKVRRVRRLKGEQRVGTDGDVGDAAEKETNQWRNQERCCSSAMHGSSIL
ncbi:hypothetical protein ZIOFF_004628 [Zingiber officinale]|uniref:DDE Tnp4 domain-containing protein n=1 Tax=Zingiber officinale TaxID=94328 RepID=A0A8J5HT72_ZINOF|nr:hypothetical protein ZIOFF_004628 [Zingiber officinale]